MCTHWCFSVSCDLCVKGLPCSQEVRSREMDSRQRYLLAMNQQPQSSYPIIITPSKAIGLLPSRSLFLLPLAALLAHFLSKMRAPSYHLIYGMDNNPNQHYPTLNSRAPFSSWSLVWWCWCPRGLSLRELRCHLTDLRLLEQSGRWMGNLCSQNNQSRGTLSLLHWPSIILLHTHLLHPWDFMLCLHL